jgi:drug/metabolite transporter, DME family
MSRHYGSFLVLAAAVLWGTTGPVQVLARLPVAPAAVGGMRILTGGLVLLAWTLVRWATGRMASPLRQRRHWRSLLAASCATGVFQAAYFTSVSRTGAALATAIVFGVAPVATGLAARVIGRSALGWGWAVSTGGAVAGCILLLRPGHGSRADGVGVVLAVLAAACYAVYTVSAKRLAEEGAAMPAAVSITLIAGGLLATPWLVTAGPGLFSGRALLTAAWLGPVTTAAAYMLFVQGLRTVSAAAAGTLSLAEPLVAALAGIWLLHEHLTAPAVIGCGMLAAGLACASLASAGAPQLRWLTHSERWTGSRVCCTTPVRSSRTQVHGVLQPGRERGHDLVGVIPGAVEPPVHQVLHPPPQRIEHGRRRQGRCGHRHRRRDRQHLSGQQHQAWVQPDQQAGDDGVGQGAGDDPVDVVQPVTLPLPGDRAPAGSGADRDHPD